MVVLEIGGEHEVGDGGPLLGVIERGETSKSLGTPSRIYLLHVIKINSFSSFI